MLDVQENKISWYLPSNVETKANLHAEISECHALNMITELFTRRAVLKRVHNPNNINMQLL